MEARPSFPALSIGFSEDIGTSVRPGLAVDIDETLSNTVLEWAGRALETFGNPEGLTPQEIVDKYRYFQGAPYFRTPQVDEWRMEQKYSNDLQTRLPLISGAREGMDAVNMVVPISCYLTARPEAVMEGTARWLSENGFPAAPIVHAPFHINHENSMPWKVDILMRHPTILGIIEDHPNLLSSLPQTYTGAIFLYNHSSLPQTLLRAYACPDWPSVVERVREAFPS